jgi:hypothetical protein
MDFNNKWDQLLSYSVLFVIAIHIAFLGLNTKLENGYQFICLRIGTMADSC